eukprot:308919-Chlamydomonas_euryale.AAC.1
MWVVWRWVAGVAACRAAWIGGPGQTGVRGGRGQHGAGEVKAPGGGGYGGVRGGASSMGRRVRRGWGGQHGGMQSGSRRGGSCAVVWARRFCATAPPVLPIYIIMRQMVEATGSRS